ncbi:MAG: hypothetical protein ACRETW_08435 [Stenotrophobium sp.]
MPRKSKKAPPAPEAAKSYDEFADDTEAVGDEEVGEVKLDPLPAVKLRDWRDVEKYREERELRNRVDDDLDLLDDLLGKPARARR